MLAIDIYYIDIYLFENQFFTNNLHTHNVALIVVQVKVNTFFIYYDTFN